MACIQCYILQSHQKTGCPVVFTIYLWNKILKHYCEPTYIFHFFNEEGYLEMLYMIKNHSFWIYINSWNSPLPFSLLQLGNDDVNATSFRYVLACMEETYILLNFCVGLLNYFAIFWLQYSVVILVWYVVSDTFAPLIWIHLHAVCRKDMSLDFIQRYLFYWNNSSMPGSQTR